MYNRNNHFECRWQPSRALFIGYCAAQLLAQCSVFTLALPFPAVFALSLVCLAHGAWVLPRHVLLSSAHSITGLQRSPQGWAVFSRARGWQPVQLRHDSLALPLIVVLRYRVAERRWPCSVCIPADALATDTHRRLRLRLRFSRDRFKPPVRGVW